MPQFLVRVPATMAIDILVEADDEEAAKGAAFQVDFGLKVDAAKDVRQRVEISEFEMHSIIVKGNCFSGVLNEIEVEET